MTELSQRPCFLVLRGRKLSSRHPIANFVQDHFFGGGCATDTAVTEMVRRSGGDHADSTIEDIRRVVQNCRGQNGKREVQDVLKRDKRRSLD